MWLHKDQQLKVRVCSWLDRVVVCLVDVAPQRSAAQGTRVCSWLDRVVVCLVDVAPQRSAAQGTRVFLAGSCRSVFS